MGAENYSNDPGHQVQINFGGNLCYQGGVGRTQVSPGRVSALYTFSVPDARGSGLFLWPAAAAGAVGAVLLVTCFSTFLDSA